MSAYVDHDLSPQPPAKLMSDADLAAALGVPSLTPADESASEAATAVIQQYLDRALVFAEYVERHFGCSDGTLQLLQYPVISVSSILSFVGAPGDLGQPITGYRLTRPTGILLGVWGYEIEVTYEAGYEILPPDLRAAFLMTFSAARALSTPEAIAAGGGPVSKVSVVGVGSVEYEFGNAGSSGDGIASPWGLIPANAVALLRPYRNHGPCGVG
jgi:hypothetical protein